MYHKEKLRVHIQWNSEAQVTIALVGITEISGKITGMLMFPKNINRLYYICNGKQIGSKRMFKKASCIQDFNTVIREHKEALLRYVEENDGIYFPQKQVLNWGQTMFQKSMQNFTEQTKMPKLEGYHWSSKEEVYKKSKGST